ncbi:conserved hypothetical protein [Methanosalsum zhilinae DSM 4017]|uniref:Uncharacterized protein n=1 Tax=Methanosalsum zhilinae (strain DSM 4017 / NBRC 107636 / OCM 62 / WeN5) TaxID=679901 RepID=F7XQ99_METZD|nr:hypothetical protein [Methanosalsum zhilinae]AEH61561.1 conserved hypothetical protein [Methanosalsum zhilinae DSM 4017]
MTDFIIIWDSPILFEKLFQEHGFTCTRVHSSALNTPYLPPCRSIIIPTGFANPDYTKILPDIEKCSDKLKRFVEDGGMLVIYGPAVESYEYKWLPFDIQYRQNHESTLLNVAGEDEHGAHSIVENTDIPVECDGYFSGCHDPAICNDRGEPVMIIEKLGQGAVILTSIHEFPSASFLKWIADNTQKTKI